MRYSNIVVGIVDSRVIERLINFVVVGEVHEYIGADEVDLAFF